MSSGRRTDVLRVPQALLHAASPGGERVHRGGQLLKGVEAVSHRLSSATPGRERAARLKIEPGVPGAPRKG